MDGFYRQETREGRKCGLTKNGAPHGSNAHGSLARLLPAAPRFTGPSPRHTTGLGLLAAWLALERLERLVRDGDTCDFYLASRFSDERMLD